MQLTFVLSLLTFLTAGSLWAQTPQMTEVTPGGGKIGAVLRVQGIYLGKARVDEVYLTDHTFDMKVKVLAQSEEAIEFRIPPSVKPGRLQLLVKTTGKRALLLEQPVFITVEEPKENGEVASSQ